MLSKTVFACTPPRAWHDRPSLSVVFEQLPEALGKTVLIQTVETVVHHTNGLCSFNLATCNAVQNDIETHRRDDDKPHDPPLVFRSYPSGSPEDYYHTLSRAW